MSHVSKLTIALLAFFFGSTLVYATSGIGGIAENLMAPTEIITKVVHVVCYIVGLALLLTAFAQYKIHRQSPKLVPLTTPITLAVLGLIGLLIPYGTHLFGPNASVEDQGKGRPSEQGSNLPLPDSNSNRGSLVPLPGEGAGSESAPPTAAPSPEEPAPAAPPSGGGGNWTNQPQYNR